MSGGRIFAVEGAWSSDLSAEETIRPSLEALRVIRGVKYIHRHVETGVAVKHLLDLWTQHRYDRYHVAYLAFHGKPGEVLFHGKDSLTLADLAEHLDGRLEGRVIHFGSCSVLNLDDASLQHFARRTGARAVSGYTQNIDWLESTALDLLVLNELLKSQRLPDAARRLHRNYPGLARKSGLILATATTVVDSDS